MKVEHRTVEVGEVVADAMELVSRARQRTSEELSSLSSNSSASYVVAISGNTPYVALPNGMTVVMRRCGTWGC